MPNNINQTNVILIGAGYMAREYTKVLNSLTCKFTVIGNKLKTAKEFELQTGVEVKAGGIYKINDFSEFTHCINTVRSDLLHPVNMHLLNHGAKKILCEKPGALYLKDLRESENLANQLNVPILIAYNRRFYASVKKLLKLASDDGGVESFYFDFTEWEEQWNNQTTNKQILLNLFIMNSLHVIDLAFFIGGTPKSLQSFVSGYSDWHQKAMVFSGAGITVKKALFSYNANWGSAGRWGIEVNSKNFKYILRPLEELRIMKKTTASTIYVSANKLNINDNLDIQFKPGIYNQTLAYLKNIKSEKFINIHEHTNNIANFYMNILKGSP